MITLESALTLWAAQVGPPCPPRCQYCRSVLRTARTGRPRKTCSHACRQQAWIMGINKL